MFYTLEWMLGVLSEKLTFVASTTGEAHKNIGWILWNASWTRSRIKLEDRSHIILDWEEYVCIMHKN
jgi:hypothetical protein